jgi:hypothetical protein
LQFAADQIGVNLTPTESPPIATPKMGHKNGIFLNWWLRLVDSTGSDHFSASNVRKMAHRIVDATSAPGHAFVLPEFPESSRERSPHPRKVR